MRKLILVAAAAAAATISSSAFAAFTVTAQPATVAGLGAGLTAYDIFAVTSGDANTKLLGASVNYSSASGKKAYFLVVDNDDGAGNGPDGIPDTVNLYNFGAGSLATASSLRLSSTVANGGSLNNVSSGNLSYVGVTPTTDFAQPNPWTPGVTSFKADYAALGSAVAPLATAGFGARLARLIVDAAGTATFSGAVGGENNTAAQPFSLQLGGGPTDTTAPVFGAAVTPSGDADVTASARKVTVDFKKAYGTKTFTLFVPVTDDTAVTSLVVSSNTVAGLVVNGSPVAAAGGYNLSLSLTRTNAGSVDPLAGALNLTAADAAGNTAPVAITFAAVPEPTTLAGLAGMALLGLRRRK